MKSFRRHIKEASYEVKINGLPDMYIDSKSPVTIKKQLRKQLRQPDDLVSITRITKADKINVFRDRIRSAPLGEVAGPSDCWDGYKKDGTQAGTGKNKGKRVNKCVPENMKSFKEHAGIDEALVGLGLAVADKAIRYGPKAYKAVKKAIPVVKKVYNKVKTYIKPNHITGVKKDADGEVIEILINQNYDLTYTSGQIYFDAQTGDLFKRTSKEGEAIIFTKVIY